MEPRKKEVSTEEDLEIAELKKHLPLGQNWLVDLVHAFGLLLKKEVLCYGTATKGMEAAAARDLITFYRRLFFLSTLTPDNINEKIEGVQKKIKIYAEKAKAEVTKEIEIEKENQDSYRYTVINKNIKKALEKTAYKKIRQQMELELHIPSGPTFPNNLPPDKQKDFELRWHNESKNLIEQWAFNQRVNKKVLRNLTQEEQYLSDIPAFFYGIAIAFAPGQHSYLFQEYKKSSQQNVFATFELTHPKELDKTNMLEISPPMAGIYNKKDLILYFQLLAEKLKKYHCSQPVELFIHRMGHATSLSYDPLKDQWNFIEPNKLSLPSTTSKIEIAQQVLSRLSNNDVTAMSAQILTTNTNETDQITHAIEEWKMEINVHQDLTLASRVQWSDSHQGKWLHAAAKAGDLADVKKLLNCPDTDPNAIDKYGSTALNYAAKGGFFFIVQALLAHKKIEVNPVTAKTKGSPFLKAVENGYLNIVHIMLADKRVDIDQTNRFGQTALFLAAGNGHMEILKELLKENLGRQKYLFAADNFGHTPLHEAARKGRLDIVNMLVTDKRIDLDQKSAAGKTALMLAAENGQVEVMQALLNAKTDINEKDNDGNTALHLAAKNGHIEAVNMLLPVTDIKKMTRGKEKTPAFLAAENKKLDMMIFLAGKGIQLTLPELNGMTPLDLIITHYKDKDEAQIGTLLTTYIQKNPKEREILLKKYPEYKDLLAAKIPSLFFAKEDRTTAKIDSVFHDKQKPYHRLPKVHKE